MTATQVARSRGWTWLPKFGQQQLPRYTSYPPATRLTAAIGPSDAIQAMEMLPPESTLSLYVHIPYCQKLCWYCGCHTSVPTVANPLDAYLASLEREIRQSAALLPASVSVTHLHFGGGSPDILGSDGVTRLMQVLRSCFSFHPSAEVAAELDPRGVTPELADALGASGFTRSSLGLQTLAPEVQLRINRVQPRATVERAVRLLKSAGVGQLNLDLMYGLPRQTEAHVVETAQFAAALDANRLALFGYAHVPWFKKHQNAIREVDLPTGEARFAQAAAGADTLISAGYRPIGFDHFASPFDELAKADASGTLRRNFQGYTDDAADALLGFGASAISSFPDIVWQNSPDTEIWRGFVDAGQPAVSRGVRPTAQERRIGRLIEQILCQLEAEIPQDLRIAACPALAALECEDLVRWCGTRLMITEKGRPYARNVAAAFDPDMRDQPGRHSLAV